jgi:tRNA (cytidine/uridine-2'-O-)-methyltransferase
MLQIVLIEPEIPPNTGNIIRLCANSGARLHLVGPLGFDLDKRSLRRAGLDYRVMAEVQQHADFASCRRALGSAPLWAVETCGALPYAAVNYSADAVLVFGSERRGLSEALLRDIGAERVVTIPMLPGNRSLNLSNSVAIVLYEAWRQNGFR